MSKQEYKGNRRNYLLVLNLAVMDHYEEIRDYLLEELGANYFVSSIEENEQENLHMHIFVQFPKCTRISYKKCFGAHVEECFASEKANINYTTKYKRFYGIDNVIDEYGTCRFGLGQNQHTMKAMDLMNLPFEEVEANQYKTWQALQGFESKTVDEIYKPDVKIYYVWGPSGCGKSKFVFDKLKDSGQKVDRVKYCNGFWQGVNPFNMPEAAWYDEFRSSSMPAYEFINFIDYYKNIMNIKYQTGVYNNYKTIYITSIEDPTELYRNMPEEARQQWLRRMEIIELN